jgi:tetratricopeptide (TPR) repeat protein
MAEELGLEELQAHALNNIGTSRLVEGDDGGFADFERSIEIADAINSVESARAYGNLASALVDFGELERAWEMLDEARVRAERFGLDDWLNWLHGESAWPLYYTGSWDEAIRVLDELIEDFGTHRFWMETPCRLLRGRMRLARGETSGAREDAERGLHLSEEAKDPQVRWPALAFAAGAFLDVDPQRAEGLIDEVLSDWEAHGGPLWGSSSWMPDAAVVIPLTGRAIRFLEGATESSQSPWERAAVAYVSGDAGAAADLYRDIGATPEEAYARLRAAHLLVQENRRAEADAELEKSLAFWRSVGATAYIRQGEALMAASA